MSVGTSQKTQEPSKVYAKDVAVSWQKQVLSLLFGTPKKKVIAVAIVLLVIAGITTNYVWQNRKHQQAKETKAYTDMVETFGLLQSRSQYKLAEGVLQKYLATNPSKREYRYQAEFNFGITEQNLNQQSAALEWYKRALADTDDPSDALYYNLGMTSQAVGDKQAALGYYKQSLAKLAENKSTVAGVRQRYVMSVIEELEK